MTPPTGPSLEVCEGCGGSLPLLECGATHRYMTSSAACWAAFASLNDPARPLEDAPFNALVVDAFAAQHPGAPSPQSINSVAVHLMVLYGVLERQYRPAQALWLRNRPGRPTKIHKHDRFHWLTPPSFAERLTVADIVADDTPGGRSSLAEAWVKDVWAAWAAPHGAQVTAWFEAYIVSERL